MKPYATLISFGVGDIYARYLNAMFESAEGRFFSGRAQLLELTTPYAGLFAVRDRHTAILRARRRIRGEFVFLLDADMLFEGPVDEEIVADGVTVTVHPAMMPGTDPDKLTYERNPESAAYIPYGEGSTYHPGGIVGAPRAHFFDLSREIDRMCREDGDLCPVWQDESYLNRILVDNPPALILDERYCAWFNRTIPDARIRALNKTPEEFAWRDAQAAAAPTTAVAEGGVSRRE